jgi:hypothetical protein
VLVTGSVVAVGEARTLLVTHEEPTKGEEGPTGDADDDWDADYDQTDEGDTDDPFAEEELR